MKVVGTVDSLPLFSFSNHQFSRAVNRSKMELNMASKKKPIVEFHYDVRNPYCSNSRSIYATFHDSETDNN
jgi:hypothetical protein